MLSGTMVQAQPGAKKASQRTAPPTGRVDSVTVVASQDYHAGKFHRWLLGSPNRGLWATPIRVPVVDLRSYAGGLRVKRIGGSNQTKSLYFESPDGSEYVFRLSDKTVKTMPEIWRHTVVENILQDQVSAMHPAAGVMTPPLAAAGGVLHPTPMLAVLPDDAVLGEARAEFAGQLGMLERVPTVPKNGPGFANAAAIIESDSLLRLLNASVHERVNQRSVLAARLLDMLINDNDRHGGNWRWARFDKTSPWEPIARDRDHAFIAFDGAALRISRRWMPKLVEMNGTPSAAALAQPEFIDARLLSGLERPVWGSVATALQARITDSVIHEAVSAMPAEFQKTAPELEATLKQRRDALFITAGEYYRLLSDRVQVHGTDSADRVVVTREPDAFVSVRLESGGATGFARRFDPRETSEIRVYLHGGDDTAHVIGNVPASIKVRIVGGNGNNMLTDSSMVAGEARPTRFYDVGPTSGVTYGADTMFNRRPWEADHGSIQPPQRDNGVSIKPLLGLSTRRRLGLVPYFGVARYAYGFNTRPYSSMVKLEGEWAFEFHSGSVTLTADKRLEASPFYYLGFARVSDLEMVNYNGLGNNTVDSLDRPELTAVHQRQTELRPAIGWAPRRWDISLGPVFRVSGTDSASSPYVAATKPYGYGKFMQAGLQLEARYEWRSPPTREEQMRDRALFTFQSTYTPAAFDVKSAYTTLNMMAGASVTIPVVLRPLLVVRGGAGKVFGEFPFFDAVFLGSGGPLRYMDPQRYAGDAGVYATSELRIPVARFRFLMPIRVGVLGLTEGGRVFVDGESPGGWHSQYGAGFWIAKGNSLPVVTFARTTEEGREGFRLRFGLNF